MDRNNKAYERMSTYLVTKGILDLLPPIDVVPFLCATRLMFRIPKADLDKYTSLRKFLNNIAPWMGLKLLQEHTIMFMGRDLYKSRTRPGSCTRTRTRGRTTTGTRYSRSGAWRWPQTSSRTG